MVEHLSACDILYHRQFGFHKGHSTTDTICNLVSEVLTAFEAGQFLLAVFIDLRKAFDTCSHSVILQKLECLGVTGTELSWFRDYLSNRCQYVHFDGHTSDLKEVDTGVPQGSLLSVLLFQLIVNDMHRCLKYCTSILYADDTTFLITGKMLRFMRCKMQYDLNALSEWLKLNLLKLNVKMIKSMVFSRDGLFPKVDLNVDNESIETVRNFRFLGIELDGCLSFERHFCQLYQKLQKSCYVIRILSQILPSVSL